MEEQLNPLECLEVLVFIRTGRLHFLERISGPSIVQITFLDQNLREYRQKEMTPITGFHHPNNTLNLKPKPWKVSKES